MLWSYKTCQKVGVGKGLGQLSIKNLLAHAIQGKIFGRKCSNPLKLNRERKVWHLLLHVFNCYSKNRIS